MNLYRMRPGDLGHDYAVVCPRCGRRARVTRDDQDEPEWRMVCAACGLARKEGIVRSALPRSRPDDPRGPMIGTMPETPPWPLELWYSAPCCGQTLSAINERHLALLREHIAGPRDRGGPPWVNGSIASRLPRWMTSARNRVAVLKAMDVLLQKSG